MLSSISPDPEQGCPVQAQDELAAFSFVHKFYNNGYSTSTRLNICALHDALYSLFLNCNKHKILILYLHNQDTEFSRNFCSFVSSTNLEILLDEYFTILGWDVEDGTFEEGLSDTLSSVLQLKPCIETIKRRESAAIFITLIDMNIEIVSMMKSSPNLEEFRLNLEILIDCFCTYTHDDMVNSGENGGFNENYSYEEFQQRMYDGLGDRDYDLFEANESEILKEKIAFALFGMQVEESGYADKQKEERDKMYESILKENNEFCEYENQVVMTVIYNCLVPLENDEGNNVYTPVPVFILRKCRESENPCRIVIDHTRRVYESWNDYLEDNKFCKCFMVVPEDGRYSGDEHGRVKIRKIKSPACSVGKKILKATDVSSTVLGLGSTGFMVAAAIPAITIGPAALLGAAAVGAGVGIYSIGRSIHTLVDRGKHKESMKLSEPEARGAYINIAAGTVGFAGAGANVAVSQLVANGATIGTTARIAVNTLGVANIGIGGLAVGNSAVEIFMRWWIDDETPSVLTVLQLSTSILFFSHAVYNFKPAGTIIEETQANVLNDYKSMLKSNRQRKMFRKLELETIRLNNGDAIRGRAEVIAATLRMKNKDDVFAFLVRSNKKFNEMGIKFSAKGGRVTFNGIPMDLSEISSSSRSEVYNYFSDLSNKPSSNSNISTSSRNFDFGHFITADNALTVVKFVSEVVNSKSLRQKIFIILSKVFDFFGVNNGLNSQIAQFFNQLFPNGVLYLEYTNMILSFIKKQVEVLQEKFRKGESDDLYDSIFKYLGDLDEKQRKLLFLQLICDQLILALQFPSSIWKKLEFYIMEWCINADMRRQERHQREAERKFKKSEKITCDKCTGYFFK